MIFNVPIEFNVTGTRVGKTRKSTTRVWDYHQIDIPFVGEENAPVAVSWMDVMPEDLALNSLEKPVWGPVADDGGQHTRLYDGEHWRPILEEDVRHRVFLNSAARLDADSFADVLSREDSAGMFSWSGFSHEKRRQLETDRDPLSRFATIESSYREDAATVVEVAARNLLVVDGFLYVRCQEPKVISFPALEVTGRWDDGTPSSGHGVNYLRVVTDDMFAGQIEKVRVYPVALFKEALTEATALNRSRGGSMLAINRLMTPMIELPGLADTWHVALKRFEFAALEFLERFEQTAGTQTTERMRGYCDMFDAFQLRHTDEGVTAFEIAAERFLASQDRPGRAFVDPALLLILERAVSYVENREIGLDTVATPASGRALR